MYAVGLKPLHAGMYVPARCLPRSAVDSEKATSLLTASYSNPVSAPSYLEDAVDRAALERERDERHVSLVHDVDLHKTYTGRARC